MLDTHTLWWYLKLPARLSTGVSAVFRLAETGNAVIIVPAIVVAELYFLSIKLGQTVALTGLLDSLAEVEGVEVSVLGRTQLELLEQLPEIPEMHDRLIAAEALAIGAPLLTRDAALAASSQIETVW